MTAAAFGASLHVCGVERVRLLQAIEPFRADPNLSWQEAAPTLEDIFIHLIGTAPDALVARAARGSEPSHLKGD